MLIFPSAKLNLGLYITGRRSDGYHNLETVFFPLPELRDALEIVPARGSDTTLHLSGIPVEGNGENNLVWKGWKMMQDRYPGNLHPVDIYLHKAIPMGAGLGGGSADGAFALRLFNDYYRLGLGNEELATMALTLGSDCPFFIYNTPQFAGGRGEEFTPIPLDLSKYSIQVVCPPVHISTREAFAAITPRQAPFDLCTLAELPVEQWRGKVSNDFEAPVFAQHPGLAKLKQRLYESGALYASLSGSGSAVFGIFEKGKKGLDNSYSSYFFE